MKKPTTIETLLPAIRVLGDTIIRTSDNFQQLLHQPQSYSFCREAGQTLRCLSEHYSNVLVAAFDYTPDPYADDDFEDQDVDEALADDLEPDD